ncbi:S-layer homology domain-containing protein [Paenibacillus planticolens]|uniref:SLH domain-containing protein n=1 Tax=Paenibacillus planticolens TaxID=2654976 RepID=A0ABX1ZIA0_9BACL|nr:S-layer homology domain-containing protein [Paenibacillus planticolens]NOU99818.1 hypothetical protein [Paenibacillus planticolens]
MKRIHKLITFLLIAFMFLFSLPPQFASAAEPTYSLQILNDKPISIGDEVQVAVTGIDLVDVFAYELNLDFDPNLLEFKPGSDRTLIPGFRVPAIVDAAGGHLQFAHSRIGAVPGDNGNLGLLNLSFIAKGLGTASIKIKNVKLVDSNLEPKENDAGVNKTFEILNSPANVASGITTIPAPAKEAAKLVLPDVPSGFTVAIKSSSNTAVIALNGTIVPQTIESTVDLVLEVTRTLDGTKANTEIIPVKVPAKSAAPGTTAEDIAKAITSIPAPAQDAKQLVLPGMPDGFTLAIKSSGNEAVIATDGTIVPPIVETTVNLVLEVTRTSDDTTASTVSIPVKVPAKSKTAAEIAETITSIPTPAKDAFKLVLPDVPTGYKVAVQSSSNIAVIALNGTVYPPAEETTVNLVLEVTRTSDGTKANTVSIPVVVPAKSKTAKEVAKGITSIPTPAKDATKLVLPDLPSGFEVAIESSSNTAVIALDETINPPAAETTVNLVLKVTRTLDGTQASTGSIPVKVPAKTEQGSSGGGGGGGDETPISPPGTHKVTPGELSKSPENGKLVIPLSGDVKQITLPSNAAELLGQNQLEIKTDKLTLDIPVDLIKQLTSGLSAETLKDSSISLLFESLSVSAAKDVVAKGQLESQADIKLNGEVYEFKLSVTKADGSTAAVLTKFDKPITIRIKVDASLNPKLAGIYYIADDGKLEYIGGKYSDGEMVAQISHFSKYAVLEVTKNFSDVPKDHWAVNVIKELAAKQIVNGTSATTFEPERSVTRAEFTSLLVRALKLTGTGQLSFTDVKSSDWYAEPVAIAVKAGIVNGKSEDVFDPNAQITREEMVTMMMRAYAVVHGSIPAAPASSLFTDEAQISSWAAAFVNQAAALHLVQGRQDGIFEPQGITSRAEAAQVIYNLLNK